MNRLLSALSLGVLTASAAAQTPAAPPITQRFGVPCDSTLTKCPAGSFPQGFFESADGNFYGIASAGGTGLIYTLRGYDIRILNGVPFPAHVKN